MDYIDLDLCKESVVDEIEDIKNNSTLTQHQKIRQVKEYFLSQKNFAYPDFVLEWAAREKLGCPFKNELEDLNEKK